MQPQKQAVEAGSLLSVNRNRVTHEMIDPEVETPIGVERQRIIAEIQSLWENSNQSQGRFEKQLLQLKERPTQRQRELFWANQTIIRYIPFEDTKLLPSIVQMVDKCFPSIVNTDILRPQSNSLRKPIGQTINTNFSQNALKRKGLASFPSSNMEQKKQFTKQLQSRYNLAQMVPWTTRKSQLEKTSVLINESSTNQETIKEISYSISNPKSRSIFRGRRMPMEDSSKNDRFPSLFQVKSTQKQRVSTSSLDSKLSSMKRIMPTNESTEAYSQRDSMISQQQSRKLLTIDVSKLTSEHSTFRQTSEQSIVPIPSSNKCIIDDLSRTDNLKRTSKHIFFRNVQKLDTSNGQQKQPERTEASINLNIVNQNKQENAEVSSNQKQLRELESNLSYTSSINDGCEEQQLEQKRPIHIYQSSPKKSLSCLHSIISSPEPKSSILHLDSLKEIVKDQGRSANCIDNKVNYKNSNIQLSQALAQITTGNNMFAEEQFRTISSMNTPESKTLISQRGSNTQQLYSQSGGITPQISVSSLEKKKPSILKPSIQNKYYPTIIATEPFTQIIPESPQKKFKQQQNIDDRNNFTLIFKSDQVIREENQRQAEQQIQNTSSEEMKQNNRTPISRKNKESSSHSPTDWRNIKESDQNDTQINLEYNYKTPQNRERFFNLSQIPNHVNDDSNCSPANNDIIVMINKKEAHPNFNQNYETRQREDNSINYMSVSSNVFDDQLHSHTNFERGIIDGQTTKDIVNQRRTPNHKHHKSSLTPGNLRQSKDFSISIKSEDNLRKYPQNIESSQNQLQQSDNSKEIQKNSQVIYQKSFSRDNNQVNNSPQKTTNDDDQRKQKVLILRSSERVSIISSQINNNIDQSQINYSYSQIGIKTNQSPGEVSKQVSSKQTPQKERNTTKRTETEPVTSIRVNNFDKAEKLRPKEAAVLNVSSYLKQTSSVRCKRKDIDELGSFESEQPNQTDDKIALEDGFLDEDNQGNYSDSSCGMSQLLVSEHVIDKQSVRNNAPFMKKLSSIQSQQHEVQYKKDIIYQNEMPSQIEDGNFIGVNSINPVRSQQFRRVQNELAKDALTKISLTSIMKQYSPITEQQRQEQLLDEDLEIHKQQCSKQEEEHVNSWNFNDPNPRISDRSKDLINLDKERQSFFSEGISYSSIDDSERKDLRIEGFSSSNSSVASDEEDQRLQKQLEMIQSDLNEVMHEQIRNDVDQTDSSSEELFQQVDKLGSSESFKQLKLAFNVRKQVVSYWMTRCAPLDQSVGYNQVFRQLLLRGQTGLRKFVGRSIQESLRQLLADSTLISNITRLDEISASFINNITSAIKTDNNFTSLDKNARQLLRKFTEKNSFPGAIGIFPKFIIDHLKFSNSQKMSPYLDDSQASMVCTYFLLFSGLLRSLVYPRLPSDYLPTLPVSDFANCHLIISFVVHAFIDIFADRFSNKQMSLSFNDFLHSQCNTPFIAYPELLLPVLGNDRLLNLMQSQFESTGGLAVAFIPIDQLQKTFGYLKSDSTTSAILTLANIVVDNVKSTRFP